MPLPEEASGRNKIYQTLISAFDHTDIVALGEQHGRKLDSDFRIGLIRDPDFPKKVHSIVVEFASTSEQLTLDRYIRGENVSTAELERIWKTTTQTTGVWDLPVYADFLAAVRDVNLNLPPSQKIRVFGGDPGTGDYRTGDGAAVSVLKQQALDTHSKALLIYGAGHLLRTESTQHFLSWRRSSSLAT